MNPTLPKDELLRLYRMMQEIRLFEEKIIEVYPVQDMKTPVHLYIGQEAIAAGVCSHLKTEDYVFTTHRSHGHAIAKGVGMKELYAEFYGRLEGCCRGKGGSMHPADPEHGIFGTTAIVGGGMPLATGTALASKMKGEDRVSVVFFGDGAADQGTFHESLNFASLHKLPVLFLCENNYYATVSPLLARQPHDDIAKRADSFDIPGRRADGNNVLEVYHEAGQAIASIRAGGGPCLLECRTYRWKGHVGPDCDYQKGCRPKEELDEAMARCPIEGFTKYLTQGGHATESELDAMLSEINTQVDEALEAGRNSQFPPESALLEDVYYEGSE